MKRNPIYLAATMAELARFVALMIVSQLMGVLGKTNGSVQLIRYDAAPQLLFAVGLFFLWLDRQRYESYRSLLLVGKLAELVTVFPLALYAGSFSGVGRAATASPATLMPLVSALALVDLGVLLLLALDKGSGEAQGAGPAELPGQGPSEVEEVKD